MCLDSVIGEKKKSIKEYFPKIGVPPERKTRRSMMDDFPTCVYTNPQCLAVIKKRDKDANAPYVKEFHDEIKKKTK